jgi:signal peptidase I
LSTTTQHRLPQNSGRRSSYVPPPDVTVEAGIPPAAAVTHIALTGGLAIQPTAPDPELSARPPETEWLGEMHNVPVVFAVEPGRSTQRARHRDVQPEPDVNHPRRRRLRRRRARRRVVLGMILMVLAFLVTAVVQTTVLTPFTVPSVSMAKTLQPGDRILVDRLAYRFAPVRRGDVIVFTDPGDWLAVVNQRGGGTDGFLVKRVIGVGGDRVSCCTDGLITVNGRKIVEPFITLPAPNSPAAATFDVTVPPGTLWVLGDNRFNSRDSSQTQDLPTKGFVPVSDVVGQAAYTIWPLDRAGPIHTADTSLPLP